MNKRAHWQLPDGVSPGTWDYSQSESIARDYDAYFRDHTLFRFDEDVTHQYVKPGESIIDLGCGTGRAVRRLVHSGFDAVGVDLSQTMLDESLTRIGADVQGSYSAVRANLVELDCFRNESFDVALCLFSTLGMIRGHDHRQLVLQHASRILKSGGRLILQVHNYWAHSFDAEGPWWMLRNLVRTWFRRDVEIGDKFYPYRGIPNMYLHSFTKRRLWRMLRVAGLEVEVSYPLNENQSNQLRWPWFWDGLRASGWVVVARKSQNSKPS